MNEFNDIELLFLKKLLSKVKYENLNLYESNQFANSPIGNSILEKIKLKKGTITLEFLNSDLNWIIMLENLLLKD